MKTLKDSSYLELVDNIKVAVQSAQQQAAMAVNSRLLFAYWQIGSMILEAKSKEGWGAKVLDNLVADLKQSFPKMKGFSRRNLAYMQKFAYEWPIVQQPAAQFGLFEKHAIAHVPWSHHMVLLDKLKDSPQRLFYCKKIKENGWSRKVLLNQLDRNLHLQQGALVNNFETTLSEQQAGIAKDTFKDPYFFDFLKLGEEASELEVEQRLVQQISSFLLELGEGFAYMGRQFKLEIGGKEYRLDLLFYHTKLHCYVNIELKIDEFKPEYVGKSQFYLTAINELLKSKHEQPSIGIILCKEANNIIIEYALKDNNAPIGVAEYTLSSELPDEMKGKLPTASALKSVLKS